MKVTVQKTHEALIPATDIDQERLSHVPLGLYEVDLKRVRNPQFHRKVFKLFNYLVENTDKWDNVDQLLIDVKLYTGMYDLHVTLNGKTIYVPKSISFGQLDEAEFQEFWKNAMEWICSKVLHGMTEEQIEHIVRY